MERSKRQEVARKRAALVQLHETLYPRIVRYFAVRIGDFTEAEDLASEVFLRALRAVDTFQEKGIPMEAWLFRIAHNLAVDWLKSRSRRPRAVSIEEENVDVASDEDPNTGLQREEELKEVRTALAQLSESQRQVLALRFSDAELTSEQVANMLGKKPTAVREMQSAAIKKLRAILEAAPVRERHGRGI